MTAKDKMTLTIEAENLFTDSSSIEATAAKLAETIAIEDDALGTLALHDNFTRRIHHV